MSYWEKTEPLNLGAALLSQTSRDLEKMRLCCPAVFFKSNCRKTVCTWARCGAEGKASVWRLWWWPLEGTVAAGARQRNSSAVRLSRCLTPTFHRPCQGLFALTQIGYSMLTHPFTVSPGGVRRFGGGRESEVDERCGYA